MARFGRRPFDVARREDDDPLDRAMAPPPNETPEEREKRLADEAEAQRRSDAIDEELNRQRLAEKRESHIRILLLGKSYSSRAPLDRVNLICNPRPERIRYCLEFFIHVNEAYSSSGKSTTLKSKWRLQLASRNDPDRWSRLPADEFPQGMAQLANYLVSLC
jgi:hypothetical protein